MTGAKRRFWPKMGVKIGNLGGLAGPIRPESLEEFFTFGGEKYPYREDILEIPASKRAVFRIEK